MVVRYDPNEFGEVVAIPLADSHGKEVDIFVKLVKKGNSLDNHVIDTVDVELQFCAGVRVAETELGLHDIVALEALEEFCGMETDTANELLGFFGCSARDAKFLLY